MAPDGSVQAETDATGTAEKPVVLGGRFEISLGQPLPTFDRPYRQAFTARPLQEQQGDPYALLCDTPRPVRTEILPSLRGIDHPSLLRLRDWGVVSWNRKRAFSVIIERPPGGPLMGDIRGKRTPIGEDVLIRSVVRPLVAAVREVSELGVFHGSIRPSNVYQGDAASGGVMLGECVSALPSFDQPPLCETIERGMTEPAGRGPGTVKDDLYSLGVTLILLHLGHNPLGTLTDEQMVDAKADKGTYPALIGSMRLGPILVELLRGLTADEPRERWSFKDVDLWLSGRRLSPKQPTAPVRANRSIRIGRKEYWYPRSLAYGLAGDTRAGARAIESEEVSRWLKRTLGNTQLSESVDQAVASAYAVGRSINVEDRLVSRVSMALDPAAPIRYRGRSALPSGLAGVMAEAFVSGKDVSTVSEMLTAQLPLFWFNVQPELRPESVPLLKQTDTFRSLIERPGPGFGAERCLYEMNPGLPCLSPMIVDQFCITSGMVLRALDRLSKDRNHPIEPVDRHIIAFLCAKLRTSEDWILRGLAPGSDATARVSAILGLLADAQRKQKKEIALPGLCEWVLELLDPVIESYHFRPRRQALQRALVEVVPSGSLSGMQRVIEDRSQRQLDEGGFRRARREFSMAAREAGEMARMIEDRSQVQRGLGRQVAAVVSTVLGSLLLIAEFFAMAAR